MTVIALGADHAGFSLKEDLKAWLMSMGHKVLDLGTDSLQSVDYPDYGVRVADVVSRGGAARGILVCGTGIGMAMVANKVPGVRAAVCADPHTAQMSREHNDANVLALGARLIDPAVAVETVKTWLDTDFAGGRHAQRVEKIFALDRGRTVGPGDHAAAR